MVAACSAAAAAAASGDDDDDDSTRDGDYDTRNVVVAVSILPTTKLRISTGAHVTNKVNKSRNKKKRQHRVSRRNNSTASHHDGCWWLFSLTTGER
jgi:hypothetical protein